jgi:hypothetical protein
MAAATAEMPAADERRDAALRMIAEAESCADGIEDGPRPYLVFDATHLRRWIGHSLVELKDPAAERILREVQTEMDSSFTRASASLTLDLASTVLLRSAQSALESRHMRAFSRWGRGSECGHSHHPLPRGACEVDSRDVIAARLRGQTDRREVGRLP